MRDPLTGACLRPHLRALLKTVTAHGYRPRPELNIGLCVSGGPDSMALAYLMKDVDCKELGIDLEPTAFIVDHNARPGSDEEAAMVSSWLQDMGIPAVIRRLDWPTKNPLDMTNFESQARIRRYQELGVAARQHNINHLFLGHHHDDQIESIMMRIVSHSRSSFLGLQGMAAVGPIPCCDEIRGLRNQEPSVHPSMLFGRWSREVGFNGTVMGIKQNLQISVKALKPGGVTVHRPLLPYPKADLVEVCASKRIPFVQDKTNTDATFTLRNAVRALRHNHELPKSLQDNSILNLMKHARLQVADIRQRGTQFLRSVTIKRFDLASGLLEVGIPTSFKLLFESDPSAASNVVQRLSTLASPWSTERHSLLTSSQLPAALAQAMHDASEPWSGSKSPKFAGSKVMFEAISPPSKGINESVTWRLSRAPISLNELPALQVGFEPDARSASSSNRVIESKWVLWDHRYWIKLRASHLDLLSAVQLRPYQQDDALSLHSGKSRGERVLWDKFFRQHAPGRIRYTLPALAINGKVAALPTLPRKPIPNYVSRKQKSIRWPDGSWLEWEVCYKVITEPVTEWATHQLLHQERGDRPAELGTNERVLATIDDNLALSQKLTPRRVR